MVVSALGTKRKPKKFGVYALKVCRSNWLLCTTFRKRVAYKFQIVVIADII